MTQRLESGHYFGDSEPLFASGGLSISQTTYPKGIVIPPHVHANSFFCFVLNGRGLHSWPTRTRNEAPMNLTLFPAEVPHANCWQESGSALHVEFASSWRERLSEKAAVLVQPRDFAGGAPTWLAQRLADECSEQDDVSALSIEGLSLELLAACERSTRQSSTRAPPWLVGVRNRLRERCAERMSLVDIAASFRVSADHLSKVFRRHNDCTVGEYLRRLRVQRACHLLRGRKTLAEIAHECGFADQSHFTRVFRRVLGITPAAYRDSRSGARYRSKR
jgi:AraC family transcriptional regulator